MSNAACYFRARQTWWQYFLCRVALLLSTGAQFASAQSLEVPAQIPSGPIRQTMPQFMRYTGWRVLYNDRALGGILTNSVYVDADVEGTLLRMIEHRNVGCTVLRAGIFVLHPLPLFYRRQQRCVPESSRRPRGTSLPSGTVTQLQGEPFEEVIVTGTYLHDSEDTGSFAFTIDGSHPLWFGATTVPGLLRRFPQDFKGGPSEDTRAVGPEAGANSGDGVAANLRGLGARASLVMLNNHRIAPSGDQGDFVDLLNVPLSAVERIDVVMDGTSALYGSDAVGGVINIITRQRFAGSELFADLGGNADGSQHQYRMGYIGGMNWATGHAVVAAEGYGREPLPAQRRMLAHSDLTPWGPNLGTPYSDPGTLVTSEGTYALPMGMPGSPINFQRLVPETKNLTDVFRDADVLPRQGRGSLYAAIQQAWGDHLAGFANVLWNERWTSEHIGPQVLPLSIPINTPFLAHVPADAAPLLLEYGSTARLGAEFTKTNVRTFNLTTGLKFEWPHEWKGSLFGTDSIEQQHQITYGAADKTPLESAIENGSFNPFDGSPVPRGALNAMRRQPLFGLRSQLWEINANIDGLLFTLPGGDVRTALGGEYRNQLLESASWTAGSGPIEPSDLGRSLRAAFAELQIPIIGERNRRAAFERLDLSVTARYENYSDFGSGWTPRYWAIYSPYEGVQLRGSFARSTRAPDLGDLNESRNTSFLAYVLDPRNPGRQLQVLAWSGGNAHLNPEHAISYTAGVKFAPREVTEFQTELNYFHILFEDRIQMTGTDPVNGVTAQALVDPQYRMIVNGAPTPAFRQMICDTTRFGGDASDCKQASIDAVVDLRDLNVGSVVMQGLDWTASGSHATSLGTLRYGLWATYLLNYVEKATPTASSQNLLNTPHNPINLQLAATLGWSWRGLAAQLLGNYTNGYHDPSNPTHPDVRSWLTLDAGLQYQFDAHFSSGLDDLVVGVNVENIFNHGPPSMVNTAAQLGYDQENGELTGRIFLLRVAKQWTPRASP